MKKIMLAIVMLLVASICSASDVPYEVEQQIKQNAANAFPDNYSMQEYRINKETQAYIDLQTIDTSSCLPVSDKIKSSAAKSFPDSYSMQIYRINKECSAYARLH